MPIEGIIQPELLVIDSTLQLRKYDGKHDFALKWYQNEELVRLVDGVRNAYTRERLDAMYSYLNAHGELYFIEVNESGIFRPIGDVTFWAEDLPIVIGDPSYQGKGIGARVIQALIHRMRELGWKEAHVQEIYHYNIASRKCFEKVGFHPCGETENGVSMQMIF